MRVLLDHCVPRPLAGRLVGHEVRTTFRMGWADFDNGELLRLAAAAFDAFITTDQRLSKQQNLGALPLPVVVLVARSNDIERLEPLVPSILSLLGSGLQNRVYVVGL